MPISREVNRDFFKTWNREVAYVLGFFAADGYMSINRRGSCFISFHIKDLKHLKIIRSVLDSNHKISVKHDRLGIGYRIQIGSKEIFNDLLALGFNQRKFKNIRFPQMPKKYTPDFIRGYFDGDGNVWAGRVSSQKGNIKIALTSVFTSCSNPFLSEVRDTLRGAGLVGGSLFQSDGNYYRLSYGMKDTLKLFNFMYSSKASREQILFLPRKRMIFEKFIKMRS